MSDRQLPNSHGFIAGKTVELCGAGQVVDLSGAAVPRGLHSDRDGLSVGGDAGQSLSAVHPDAGERCQCPVGLFRLVLLYRIAAREKPHGFFSSGGGGVVGSGVVP